MYMFYSICAAVGGTVFLIQFILSLIGLAESDHDVGDMVGGDGFDVDHAGGGFDVDHAGDGLDLDHAGDGFDVDGAGDGVEVHHGDAGGGHHGADHAHDSSWLFGVLTFRSIIAAITFFGLTGLAGTSGELRPESTLIVAVAAGLAALYGVAQLMRSLHRLRSEGNVRIERAVGQPAKVYLAIPGHRNGAGKVTVKIQNRTMEYQAMTDEEGLPTGARVVVSDVIGPDTVEVHLAVDAGSNDHA